ncbi:MAG TPA: DUF5953 family protein, partial [Archangium sp.]|nr:DUF5953 family protein [Archangium sp.]
LGIIVYAPALVGKERRPLAIIHGMEGALPGLRLGWTLSKKEEFIALPHRDEWVTANKLDGGFPFLCNDDKNRPVTLTGWENPNGLAARSPPHFEIHGSLHLDVAGIAAAMDVLAAIGEGARAFWGLATPSDAAVEISRQTRDPVRKPGIPPRGLPLLKLAEHMRSPEIPHCLGWLNYWSPAAARAIGFPDPARDAELLSRSRRTATGGWVVRLTDAPLDLDNPAHLDALKRAYERFPEIGGRSTS